ncbi:MAG: glycosyltransferase [Acidimicrobiales bacterium]
MTGSRNGPSGWEVHAAAGGPEPDGLCATSYSDIDGLTQDPSLRSIKALRSLADWRATHELDLVVVNTATASALYRLLPRRNTRTVYFCHGLHFGDRPETPVDRAFWLAERALLGRTDGAIVMNSADVEFFTGALDKSLVHMLDAGVGLDTDAWTPRSTRRSENGSGGDTGTKLVWMGMFTARKRPADAVRVLAALRHEAEPETTLTMLGTGPLADEVRELIHELGLADAVTMPGQVDPRSYLADADVLVHTAEWEGYCRTLMEASYIGLPAVSYDVKGCRDVFGVEAIGQPGDVHGLAKAVLRVREAAPAIESRPDFSWQSAFESTSAFLERTFAVR